MSDNRPSNSAPRITIALPVYNGSRFIDAAIRSIRAQTMPDFQLLIADNASSDDTLQVCRRHAAEDARIRVMTAHANEGAARNFNRTVPEARAPFFKWAAHDDLIEPTYLETCLQAIEKDPSVVLAYPLAVDIDADDAVIGRIQSRPYATHRSAIQRARDFLSFDTACVETFGVIRTDVLRSTALIGSYTSSDRTLLFELAMRGRFVEVDETLMMRRQHETRSVNVAGRERNAWFDPSRRPGRTFPRWRLMAELQRAVLRAPVPLRTRLLIHSAVARWASRRWKTLLREIGSWMRWEILRRRASTPTVGTT